MQQKPVHAKRLIALGGLKSWWKIHRWTIFLTLLLTVIFTIVTVITAIFGESGKIIWLFWGISIGGLVVSLEGCHPDRVFILLRRYAPREAAWIDPKRIMDFMSTDGVALFFESNWERAVAPVVPPRKVVEELQETGKPVWWENGTSKWLMLYRTEFEGDKIITRLRPGSIQPTKRWLR